MTDLKAVIENVANDKGTIGDVFNGIMNSAIEQKASDIHMEPKSDGQMLIRFRIDGVLYEIAYLNKDLQESLVFFIKISSKLRTDEHFAPQDGKISFEYHPEADDQKSTDKNDSNADQIMKVDARISILPISYGEKIVIRLLAQGAQSLTLEMLGFMPKDLEKVEKSYKRPYGTIIAAGPTGSGKTTTLYAILKILNTNQVNTTTIEDPVEYEIDGVNHIQINPKAALTFASGLRAILRQDPNIIMVGEIRDVETALIAINAAMTGHLVLSTLHANDSITTIPRLRNLGIEPFLIASTVNMVMSQRLGRRLCSKCKKEYKLTESELSTLKQWRPDIAYYLKSGDTLYKAVGCEHCRNTGYKGRVGLYEVLEFTKNVREAIMNSATNDELLKVAKKDGFTLMLEDGIEKLKQGLIDTPELIKVIALQE